MLGLANKRVFITGAASGIGRATAERFYAEGSELVLIDIPSLEQAELTNLFPTRMTYIQGDITKAETLLAIQNEVNKGIDVIVNNAGITRDATLLKMTDDQWDSVISVNLTSVFKLSRMAAEKMKAEGTACNLVHECVPQRFGSSAVVIHLGMLRFGLLESFLWTPALIHQPHIRSQISH